MTTLNDSEPQDSRPYRPERKSRVKRAEKVTRKSRSSGTGLAEREIDKRLAHAIAERSDAMVNVAKLSYWQQRVANLTQEIDSLIGMKQRLSGVVAVPIGPPVQNWTGMTPATIPSRDYSPHAEIPPSITSGPARQPAPTTGNVASEVEGEGGFA